jgi:uncharacterized protein (TIGR00297 family)
MLISVLIGLGISVLIAGIAYFRHSLNKSGFIAATFFGTLIYVFGGILVWGTLIAFFISSSLITKLSENKDKKHTEGRNHLQVIANSLVAIIFSILYYVTKTEIFLLAAVVAISTSNSDTWASEIGSISKGKTFYIVNFKVAPKGASGAISGLGTLASFIGALFIGIIFIGLYAITESITFTQILYFGFVITSYGFLGNLIDSYLGALIQAKYRGIDTGTITENKWLPNEKVVLASGLALITNDMVNLLSALFASILTVIFFN